MGQSSHSRLRGLKLADCIGLIVLVSVLVAIGIGVLVFPVVKGIINYQDCVASGRVDCGRDSDS